MFEQTDNYVSCSPEWRRIDRLPRRTWTKQEGDDLAKQLTELLKTPNGSMTLLMIQAICLREAWMAGGLFAYLSVSAGKTLLSLLLARVLGATKPALLIPAKLVRKTEKEIREYERDWNIGIRPELLSDESLGPVSGKGTLESIAPDLIVIDEAHKFRNPRASRTLKLHRYLQAHPKCVVCCLSGSFSKRAYEDYGHIMNWCLKGNSPLPRDSSTLKEWDAALGEKTVLEFQRLHPGVLLDWTTAKDIENLGMLNAARKGVQKRVAETAGVVVYHVAAEDIEADIQITGINTFEADGYANSAIEKAFEGLRNSWILPDGQELVEGLEIYRHANTLALGFFGKWRDPAPDEWLGRRKAYNSFIRAHLGLGRRYDSPDEVAQAFPEADEVKAWKAIRKSYKPETIAVWLDPGPLKICMSWINQRGGIVFVKHVPFGVALAGMAGVPYFGAGGLDAAGNSIETFQGKACVASVMANGEGRNLHLREHPLNRAARLGFDRMLITSMLQSWSEWEQTIGRIHRLRCLAEHCIVDVLMGYREHVYTFQQCLRDAERTQFAEGGYPKLLQASISNMLEPGQEPKQLFAFK